MHWDDLKPSLLFRQNHHEFWVCFFKNNKLFVVEIIKDSQEDSKMLERSYVLFIQFYPKAWWDIMSLEYNINARTLPLVQCENSYHFRQILTRIATIKIQNSYITTKISILPITALFTFAFIWTEELLDLLQKNVHSLTQIAFLLYVNDFSFLPFFPLSLYKYHYPWWTWSEMERGSFY